MDIQKSIFYMTEQLEAFKKDAEEEDTEFMRLAYTDIASHYENALIALKYLQKEMKDGNQLSKYTEKEMLKGAEDYVEGVFRNREKQVECEDYSFEVGV